MQIKGIVDDYGVIAEAYKILPTQFHTDLIEAIAELENKENYVKKIFPKTRLHKVTGIKQSVYRADIDKISGWRLHVKFNKRDNRLHLCDIIEGQDHDKVVKIIKSTKGRYD